MRKQIYLVLIMFSILLNLAACARPSGQETPATQAPSTAFTPTPAPTATEVPQATATPAPEPTATNTPVPTATPVPHIHEWKECEKPAACEEDGKTWDECACGEIQNVIVVPAHGHIDYSYQVTIKPSVENDGIYENICNVCKAVVSSGILEKLTPTPTPTPSPTSTPTPAPTNTPTTMSTATPVPTSTPTPVPTSTPAPTPVVSKGLPELVSKKNAIMNDTVLTSEEEANRYLFQMALEGYYHFGLLVEDLSMLHTEEEYLSLFPEIISLEMESLTEYKNGYFLVFSDLKTTQVDLAYRYALRTGDTSFLTDKEYQAYQKLFQIAEELNLSELDDIDAIIAAHDYLILNTFYDEAAAASVTGGPSHYAEGLLLNGKAVCSGYASVFQLLMTFADIPCEYVVTDTHAWNMVQLGDEWYHIDVTWDDPTPDQPGVVIYTHFMMTDDEVATLKDHKNWSCECSEDHNCDDESYRIYPYKDYICTTEDEAIALLLKQADSDSISLIYPSDGALTENTLLDLAYYNLEFSGGFSYFPSEPLGDTHYLLRINNK
ncbi:MAG: hypothetical protein IJ353_07380 [Lachnospiraceae bacterium]|nr:hypothetical protein [Lachnospiraceae bacterium]MBQ7864268.1 hypothetical protein [Lachnospiraceae bacterium]